MQTPTLESVSWDQSLATIAWPKDAIFIADEALPAAILSQLDSPILIEAGEGLKTLARVGQLAEQLLARRSTRPLTIVAVGGGSIGDAVGFLASTLWRGVALWHVPTTLLAMVDSAHGGKTAVNLGHAKNQLGTFYLADRVCIVDEVLAALPLKQRQDGLAELFKALWLGDADALEMVDAASAQALAHAPYAQIGQALMALLKRAVAVKYAVVAQDPHETKGIRTWLNLGHTAAHALELSLGLTHGHAVAWGMMAASYISQADASMDALQAERWRGHLEPLLSGLGELEARMGWAQFEALVLRDKKRVGGKLRSVLLAKGGEPVVTDKVSAEQWYEVLLEAYEQWRSADILVQAPAVKAVKGALQISASKSELNRALVIQALRPGLTHVEGESEAEDVVVMRQCLEALRTAGPVEIQAGLGGTTLRFALAVAAARADETIVRAHERLLARPQDELLDALSALGALAQWVELDVRPGVTERAIRVVGLALRPAHALMVPVRCERSSQFASALAMLAASGRFNPLRLKLVTDDEGGYDEAKLASRSYLEMTLALLGDAGVEVSWRDALIELTPRALDAEVTLVATADESSAAVWRAIDALGAQMVLLGMDAPTRQADRVLEDHIAELLGAQAGQEVYVDLHDAPDLAPVLTALAVQLPVGMRIGGAAHLRLKESNRIEDLVSAFEQVGVEVHPLIDGLRVPPQVQRPREDSRFMTFNDHRLAMAALVLTMCGQELWVERPMVVEKSYPELWHHARQCGWRISWPMG